ncbi:MAG: 3-oxosteroid 1-dehydrogenase [Jatrophihabitantaceae bacterium]
MDEDEYDVVVVGSGAAGMSAALTAAKRGLRTVLIEKAAHYGGSTARSGGGVWIPNNDALRSSGVPDTPAAARDYLHSIIGDVVPAERIDAYLTRGPEALAFVFANTPLKMGWVRDYSDYYPEAPGGRVGGRSIEPKPFNGKKLGQDLDTLEPPYGKAPLNVAVTQADFRWATMMMRHPKGVLRVLRIGLRWIFAMTTGKRLLVMGQALSAAMRKGLRDAGVPVLLETALDDLVVDDDGVVVGVVVTHAGRQRTLQARRGVILAAGGFEHNAAMRAQYQRAPIGTGWTVGAAANTGDAIRAGERLGGALELMDDAWWGPTIPLPGGPWFCLAERTLPGGIMINDRGQRFMNEAAPYVEAVHSMYGGPFGQGDGPGVNIPSWMVIDQRYRNRYVFAGVPPRRPFPGHWLKTGVVTKAGTLAELAEKIGVDSTVLSATVERFNAFAKSGVDEDYRRGESGYDRYYGDPTIKPNPSLGALVQAPFYAVKIVPGDLGTKGGLRTDVNARVLRTDGTPIRGLYAAGNSSSPVMGHTYAGPGATIGPAIAFGYLAALHIATNAPGSDQSTPSPEETTSAH